MEEKYFTRGEQSDGGDGDVVDGSLGPGLAVLGAGAGHQLAHRHQEPRHHLQLLVLGLGPARPGVNTQLGFLGITISPSREKGSEQNSS